MSARELHALRANESALSPPKQAPRGRKRLQSNADEVTSKRSKAANNDGEEGSIEVEEQKGKGNKEKKSRCVTLQYKHLPTYNPLVE